MRVGVASLGAPQVTIETHLFPESVRTLTDSLSPYVLVVVNRGSNVRLRTAALHARGNGESGNFVVDFGHRALTLTLTLCLAGILWRGRCGEGVGEGRQ